MTISHIAPADHQELKSLDPNLLKANPHWQSTGQWSGDFNVAAWLRFPETLVEPVQLFLFYRDGERRKTVAIDKCQPNRQTLILLNGAATLQVSGKVTELGLYVKGLSEHAAWILDEVRLEPAQTHTNADLKQAN